MTSKKMFFVLVCLLALVGVGLLFSVYQANTLLGNKSKTLVNVKTQDKQLAQQQAQIVQDKKDLRTYSSLNTIAKTVVPQDKNQAIAVRQITTLAAQSGIAQLSSIQFPQSTLGSNTKSPGGLTQVTAVPTIPGVYDLQITVTQDPAQGVPYSAFHTFLDKLELNRRTAVISSITVTHVVSTTGSSNQYGFTVVIDEYIKP
jgi:hypothetical protein